MRLLPTILLAVFCAAGAVAESFYDGVSEYLLDSSSGGSTNTLSEVLSAGNDASSQSIQNVSELKMDNSSPIVLNRSGALIDTWIEADDDKIEVRRGASTNMVIESGGDVGIGTDSPTNKLHVVGGVSATEFIGDGSKLSGISSSLADWSTNPAVSNVELAGYWLSNDGDAEGVFVATDGKVGIGTASPTWPFHVATDTPFQNDIARFTATNSITYSRISVDSLDPDDDTQVSLASGTVTKWSFGNDATDDSFNIDVGPGAFGDNIFKILSGGNVGIGIAPTNKLHVNGGVSATDYIGDGSKLSGIVVAADITALSNSVFVLGENNTATGSNTFSGVSSLDGGFSVGQESTVSTGTVALSSVGLSEFSNDAAFGATNVANTWTASQSFGADLLPTVSNTYSLGSVNLPWMDLYVGTGTVYLGSVALSVDEDSGQISTTVGTNAPVVGVQVGDNVSDLSNDAGYVGTAGDNVFVGENNFNDVQFNDSIKQVDGSGTLYESGNNSRQHIDFLGTSSVTNTIGLGANEQVAVVSTSHLLMDNCSGSRQSGFFAVEAEAQMYRSYAGLQHGYLSESVFHMTNNAPGTICLGAIQFGYLADESGATNKHSGCMTIGAINSFDTNSIAVERHVLVGGRLTVNDLMCEMSLTDNSTQTFTGGGSPETVTNWTADIVDTSFVANGAAGVITNIALGRFTITLQQSFETSAAETMDMKLRTNGVAVASSGWERDTGASLSKGVVAYSKTLTLPANTGLDWVLDTSSGNATLTHHTGTFRVERR